MQKAPSTHFHTPQVDRSASLRPNHRPSIALKQVLGLGLSFLTAFPWVTLSLSGSIASTSWVAPAQAAATLSNWAFDPSTQALEITVPDGITPRYFLVAEPARIVVDLPETEVGPIPVEQTYGGAVQQIRVSQFQPRLTRIVMVLSPDAVLAPEQVELTQTENGWIVRPLLASGPAGSSDQPVAANSPDPNPPAPAPANMPQPVASPPPALPANTNNGSPNPSSNPSSDPAATAAVPTLPPATPAAPATPPTVAAPATPVTSPTPTVPAASAAPAPSATPATPATPVAATIPVPPPAPETRQTSDAPDRDSRAEQRREQRTEQQAEQRSDHSQRRQARRPAQQPTPTALPTAIASPDTTATVSVPGPAPLPVPPAGAESGTQEVAQSDQSDQRQRPQRSANDSVSRDSSNRSQRSESAEPKESGEDALAQSRPRAIDFGQPLPPDSESDSEAAPADVPVAPPDTYEDSSVDSERNLEPESERDRERESDRESDPPDVTVDTADTEILIPSGTVLSLRYPGEEPLELSGDRSRQEVLVLAQAVRDDQGNILVPAGSEVLGRFESGRNGSRFIAQAITLEGENVLLRARSATIEGEGRRQVSRGRMTRNSTLGGVAGIVLGGITGIGLIPAIIAGAAGGAGGTYLNSPRPAVIEPNQVIDVQLTEDVFREY